MRSRGTRPRGTVAAHGFLTAPAEFGDVERGNPLPYTLPPDVRRRVGLERETWRLQVVTDPDSDSRIEQPLAIDFDTLLQLGERHAVRYIKALTCNNIGEPLGVGLWEGVPLRELIWRARAVENIRRVYYYGYHNDDPAQVFQSSLPIGRVLEDPPGELPVIVGYRLNGEFLSGKRGGPVRMVVPEAYGFKSVKWLQRVVLTNDWQANDTYALGNNDLESPMKTFARFSRLPDSVRAGEPIEVSGLAQVGVSGLARVQCSLSPAADDESQADWQDATILGPPEQWGGGVARCRRLRCSSTSTAGHDTGRCATRWRTGPSRSRAYPPGSTRCAAERSTPTALPNRCRGRSPSRAGPRSRLCGSPSSSAVAVLISSGLGYAIRGA